LVFHHIAGLFIYQEPGFYEPGALYSLKKRDICSTINFPLPDVRVMAAGQFYI
jgi:hypothetical protein